MPGTFESFKSEVKQLGLFALRLIIHCVLMLVILLFVLVASWMHQWFRRSYYEFEAPESRISIQSDH